MLHGRKFQLSVISVLQIVIWIVIPATRDSSADYANNTLALIVLLQYIPRLFLIFPLNQRIIKTTGVIAKTAWAGAAYNLLLYILASHVYILSPPIVPIKSLPSIINKYWKLANPHHLLLAQVLGASWYLLSIGRQNSCWKQECFHEKYSVPACVLNYLDCNSLEQPQRSRWVNATRVISRCDAKNDDSDFKFGMFADAFTSQVASSGFIEKYLYCLWWGLRNLRSSKLHEFFFSLLLFSFYFFGLFFFPFTCFSCS